MHKLLFAGHSNFQRSELQTCRNRSPKGKLNVTYLIKLNHIKKSAALTFCFFCVKAKEEERNNESSHLISTHNTAWWQIQKG